MVCNVCTPADGIVTEKLAVVAPVVSVARAAVAVGFPSRVSVTLPLGATVPADGMPMVRVVVTVMIAPAAGVVLEATTARAVVLGSVVTVTGADVAEAYVVSPL